MDFRIKGSKLQLVGKYIGPAETIAVFASPRLELGVMDFLKVTVVHNPEPPSAVTRLLDGSTFLRLPASPAGYDIATSTDLKEWVPTKFGSVSHWIDSSTVNTPAKFYRIRHRWRR